MKALSTNEHNVCVIFCVATGGDDTELTATPHVVEFLKKWIGGGGILFVHGEHYLDRLLQELGGGFKWAFEGDYYRSTENFLETSNHFCNNLPPTYFAKACMLSNVDVKDRVHAAGPDHVEGMAAMTFTSVGEGCSGFFGDVNDQKETFFRSNRIGAECLASTGGATPTEQTSGWRRRHCRH